MKSRNTTFDGKFGDFTFHSNMSQLISGNVLKELKTAYQHTEGDGLLNDRDTHRDSRESEMYYIDNLDESGWV